MSILKAALLGAVVVAANTSLALAGTGTAEFLATIRAQGTIITGSGVSASTRLNIGQYAVDFPRDIRLCAFVATPLSGSAHKAVARSTSGNPNRVLVNTFVNSASAQDIAFNLIVKCQD